MDHETGLPASKHSEVYLKTMLNANWNYDVPARTQNHIRGSPPSQDTAKQWQPVLSPKVPPLKQKRVKQLRKKAEQGHRHTASKPGFLGSSPAVCGRTPAQENVIGATRPVTAGPRSPVHT